MSETELLPPEPRHKGKRKRHWAPMVAHTTRGGRGCVGRLRRGK